MSWKYLAIQQLRKDLLTWNATVLYFICGLINALSCQSEKIYKQLHHFHAYENVIGVSSKLFLCSFSNRYKRLLVGSDIIYETEIWHSSSDLIICIVEAALPWAIFCVRFTHTYKHNTFLSVQPTTDQFFLTLFHNMCSIGNWGKLLFGNIVDSSCAIAYELVSK